FRVLIPAFPAAKPRLDEGSCPRWQNWTEGQNETLRCRARGHPEAEVICAKDGNSFPAGVWHRARCAHAGTFVCRATNALGTAERNVTLWVLCEWGSGGVLGVPGMLGVLGVS
ncbi:ICAM1 protein, partial [Menura novaehollandiae]|nr:ICAM1 protein [Menura novaehollandiae]